MRTDKASGKDVQHEQVDALMTFVPSGDTVVVHRMDRLARNLDDLRRIVQLLAGKGICIQFIKENRNCSAAPHPESALTCARSARSAYKCMAERPA